MPIGGLKLLLRNKTSLYSSALPFQLLERLERRPGEASGDKNSWEAAFVCLFHTWTSVSGSRIWKCPEAQERQDLSWEWMNDREACFSSCLGSSSHRERESTSFAYQLRRLDPEERADKMGPKPQLRGGNASIFPRHLCLFIPRRGSPRLYDQAGELRKWYQSLSRPMLAKWS